jgi:hypothetical protein
MLMPYETACPSVAPRLEPAAAAKPATDDPVELPCGKPLEISLRPPPGARRSSGSVDNMEGLQMFADDGVEDRVLGVAGLIRAMGMVHAPG